MRLLRAAWPVIGASCLLLVVASACASTESSNVNGNGSGADGSGADGSGASTSTSGRGPILGLGGDGDGTTTGGSTAVGPECAGELIEAQRIPLDIYVMLDVSGSMSAPTEGDANVTKWQAVSSALTDFVNDEASEGIGMGLQVFPIANAAAPKACISDQECGEFGPCLNRGCWPLINGTVQGCLDSSTCAAGQSCVVIGECSKNNSYACDRDATATCNANRGDCVVPPSICVSAADCRPATYAAAAAEIAPLPEAAAALVKVIQGSTPDEGGLTPTGPALTGAIQASKAWAKAHPDHQVVAVLATDGLPTLQTKGQLCEVVQYIEDIDAVVNLAGSGRTAAPLISTFVIGVLGPDDIDFGAPATLDAIAMSGGTEQAFIVETQGDVQKQFRDALNQIRASGLSCELAVPEAEAGKTVDFGKVNVSFDDGTGATDLLNWPDAAGCDADGGWYYNVDPAQAAPTRIIACPTTCTAFQQTDMGSVQIKLGCATRTVVK